MPTPRGSTCAPGRPAPVTGTIQLRLFARAAMGRDLLGRGLLGRDLLQAPRFSILASHDGWLLVEDFARPGPPPLPGARPGARVGLRSTPAARA